MAKSRYVNLYLPEEIVSKVDSIADKEERSRNFTIKKILEKYLENGNFYTRNKTNSKNYFLKFDGIKKRDELLNNALSKII